MVRFAHGVLALLFCSVAWPASAQTVRTPPASRIQDPLPFRPNERPNLQIGRAAAPITVDGELDDEGWSSAGIATSFSETYPGDQTVPPIGIEVWVTYDAENLYLAYLVEDRPDRIRANMSDRDAIWQDDYVGMILDPYGDNAWAYFLAANPFGIQGDTKIMNGGQEDVGFDVVYESEGRITDSGYQVELAIPFRSLRFPNAPSQEWNLTFWITHPRESRSTYSWAAMSRDDPCSLCQLGSVSGIAGVRPGGKVELLPAVTGSQSGTLVDRSAPTAGLDNDRLTAEPSLGLKYSFTSNAIADLAVNPDFSQIEADAAQIDVNTTFALFFPERRPFFQEGSDLFSTPIDQVYSRSINNPSAAAKFTGRFGRTSVGYIGGLDEDTPIILPFEDRSMLAAAGHSYSNVLRYRRTVGTSSYVGGLVSDRRYLDDGGSGSTVGVDARFMLTRSLALEGQLVASRTVEQVDPDLLPASDGEVAFGDGHTAAFDGESFGGYAAYVSVEQQARHLFFDLDFWRSNPTFRAANGFVTQNSINRSILVGGYRLYFEDSFVERLTPHFITGYWWNHDGVRKDEFAWLSLEGRFKGQTNAQLQFLLVSNERFLGQDFRGLRRVEASVYSNFSDPVKLGGGVSYGRSIARNLDVPEMGRALEIEAEGTFRPWSRLVVQPAVDYFRLSSEATGDELFSGYILRTRVNYQFTRRLFLRLITQYNDFARRLDVDPLVTYKVNPFTAVYVGSTHDFVEYPLGAGGPHEGFYQTDRQIFFKLQYLFRM
jgi:hypothetical protein